MKKIIVFLVVLALCMGMMTTAFAANVTITGVEDRNFDAYKILNASVGSGDNTFAYTVNAKYREVLLDAVQAVKPSFSSSATDAEIIAEIGTFTSEDMNHFSNALYLGIKAEGLTKEAEWDSGVVTSKALEEGYWLIADVTDLSSRPYDVNSVVMIDTVGKTDITVAAKPDKTKDDKNVDDENDSVADPVPENEDSLAWGDSADYDVGDSVPYQVTGKLANDIVRYKYYSFKIVDTASAGLTFDTTSFEMTVNAVEKLVKAKGEAGADFWWEIDTATNTLYVYPAYGYENNAKENKEANKDNGGDFLKLFPAGTDHANINSSTFTFSYTCTVDEDAVVGGAGNTNNQKLVISNNPYGDTFGETPGNTNIVFTYSFIVNKIDKNGDPLAGAEFALYKFMAVPQGTKSDAEMEAAGYVKHAAANSWGKFELVEEIKVAGTTTFGFKGIDDGYYKLVETKAPDGYHKIEDLEFHVVATHTTEKVTNLEAIFKNGAHPSIDGDELKGTLTTDIVNHTGTELPTTGGMGTTIFYIAGAAMVLAALVLLITRKRMNAEG